MGLSSEEIEDTIDVARECLESKIVESDAEVLALDFAEALVQVADACVVGVPCEKHGGAVHGREAEELRKGIERISKDLADCEDDHDREQVRHALRELLDDVDARDSLAQRRVEVER